jgi:hypothetical protein
MTGSAMQRSPGRRCNMALAISSPNPSIFTIWNTPFALTWQVHPKAGSTG